MFEVTPARVTAATERGFENHDWQRSAAYLAVDHCQTRQASSSGNDLLLICLSITASEGPGLRDSAV